MTASRPASARLLAAAVLFQPLMWLGGGIRQPWAALGIEHLAVWLWGALSVAFLAGAPAITRALAEHPRRLERIAVTLIVACPFLTVAIDHLAVRRFAAFGYRQPHLVLLLESLVLVTLLLWIRAGSRRGIGIWIATTAAVSHRLLAMHYFPDDARRSDMLAAIRGAIELAAGGLSPYAVQPVSAEVPWPILMPYLPGTWLAHWPVAALGADLRWTGTLVIAVLGIWLAVHVRARGTELLGILLLLSPYHAFRHELYFEHFMALTVAIFLLTSRIGEMGMKHVAILGALTGVAVVTRQWAWVYAPFAILATLLTLGEEHVRWRRAALAIGVMIAVALVGMLPWTFDGGMLPAVALHFGSAGGEHGFGLAGVLIAAGASTLLRPLQLVVAIGLFSWAVYERNRVTRRAIMIAAFASWFLVVALNPFMRNYFYLSLSWAALAIVHSTDA